MLSNEEICISEESVHFLLSDLLYQELGLIGEQGGRNGGKAVTERQ